MKSQKHMHDNKINKQIKKYAIINIIIIAKMIKINNNNSNNIHNDNNINNNNNNAHTKMKTQLFNYTLIPT